MIILDKLYKKTAKDGLQEWEIAVDDNTIITRWGQVGGAIQETRDEIATGKNIGKKNETTPAEQAALEAQSQWEKKLKKGYVKSAVDARDGKTDDIITGGVFPMLAHSFADHGHKLKYPCLVQPKLDGHRCIAMVDTGGVSLWTRTRKPITSMGHVVAAIEALGLPAGTVLDGELYCHEYRDRFEELASFIRDSEARPGSEVVQYHVYDTVSDSSQFARSAWVNDMFDGTTCGILVGVYTETAENEDELMASFDGYLKLGYEGAIARNADGKYVKKRSYDLLKIKEFADAEFEVVGVEEGRGKMAGKAVFVCKTPEGAEFRAKLMGELDGLKRYVDDPSLAVGRRLTIKYQGMTKKSGVPRFPVAVRFRDE